MVYNWYIKHVNNVYIYSIHVYRTRWTSLPVISRVTRPFTRAISPLTEEKKPFIWFTAPFIASSGPPSIHK